MSYAHPIDVGFLSKSNLSSEWRLNFIRLGETASAVGRCTNSAFIRTKDADRPICPGTFDLYCFFSCFFESHCFNLLRNEF